ncbi:MAG: plasmid recombination protein [Oscillospiraceae bacterium]|nr:plasmid recombination protein [Oscillospiraceae bacterium]
MPKPQYAILRFAKYKGPEISNIEAHNERTKEKYASNPDVDTSKSHLNFHLVEPQGKYRAVAEQQIKEASCRTRTDSVRLVEALVTATPEFFKNKKKDEIRAYFQEALDFIKQHQRPETIISATVHMDEKTPHMHLSFVPLTEDNRLSAKEIVGNKKKLRKKNEQLTQTLEKSSKQSVLKKLEDERLRHQYLDAVEILERIPEEVVRAYTRKPDTQQLDWKDNQIERRSLWVIVAETLKPRRRWQRNLSAIRRVQSCTAWD